MIQQTAESTVTLAYRMVIRQEIIPGLFVIPIIYTGYSPPPTIFQQPAPLTFKVFEKSTNDVGDFTGSTTRDLILVPAPIPRPIMLGRDTYDKLATDLFDKQ